MVEPHYLKVDILLSYNTGNMLGHESSLIHFSKMCLYEKSLSVPSIQTHGNPVRGKLKRK